MKLFYPYSILVNKCGGSCNDINNFCAKLCVPDVVKNMNVKTFNKISRTNETRYVSWHKTCNNKQRWSKDKFICEYKELIDKERQDEGFIQNPSKCEYERDKSCDVRQYLNYESCKCKKNLIDKLVEKCSENIDVNELIYNATLNNHGKVCNFCTICIALLVILLVISHIFYDKYKRQSLAIFFIISISFSCYYILIIVVLLTLMLILKQ